MHGEVGAGRMGQAFAKPTHFFSWRDGRERIDERDSEERKKGKRGGGRESPSSAPSLLSQPVAQALVSWDAVEHHRGVEREERFR